MLFAPWNPVAFPFPSIRLMVHLLFDDDDALLATPGNRHFYRYAEPLQLAAIDAELKSAEAEFQRLLAKVVA